VLFAIDGAVARLTIDRPDARNAMTLDMYDALVDACAQADADPRVRVMVIRGAGAAFSAGTDIGEFTGFTSGADGIAYETRLDAVVERLERVHPVTIAQVTGAATGGGCLLAFACDLRVCTPDARFGVPVARTLGNCLSARNCARLLDLLGPAVVKDLMLTARLLEASQAAALGLVAQIAEAATIDAEVANLCAQITTYAPQTIRATKEMLRRIQEERRRQLPADDDLIAACYGSADFREGVAAFLARRRPSFTGQ
jgi:enoyl-CoA hydratase/carnithine racemase